MRVLDAMKAHATRARRTHVDPQGQGHASCARPQANCCCKRLGRKRRAGPTSSTTRPMRGPRSRRTTSRCAPRQSTAAATRSRRTSWRKPSSAFSQRITRMDFTLSDDQRMLQDTVERLVARDYGFEQRKAYAREPGGCSRAVWSSYAEIGTLGAAASSGPRRPRRRPDRRDAGASGARPRDAARAAVADHGDRQRRAARRQRRATRPLGGPDLRRRDDARLGPRRGRLALSPGGRGHAARRATAAATLLNGQKPLVPPRRQRRSVACQRTHRGRAPRPRRHVRCSWSTPARPASRAAAHWRRTACAPPTSSSTGRASMRPTRSAPRRGAAHHRVGGGGRHRGASPPRPSARWRRRLDDDRRVPQDAATVRRPDRPLPGAATPRRRDVDRARAGAQHGDVCGADAGRSRCRRDGGRRSRRSRCRSGSRRASSASRPSSCTAASA